ncbi:Lon protease family protein [Sporohalobacter salinus]|uniref:Lon protease family protein n=1 Tax=Sporohalobacter salinus TaxID=1494606 RepID=UPI00196147EA|nr:AAA family ATPase [Sporohalobacter salinus]MBM7624870.1 lon-related putative ATP-dependent protease [Sporohalobacter salinus]
MKDKRKLTVDQLNCDCKPERFDFETTDELEPITNELIGQDRAVNAMDLGLKVKQEGYNIFISGIPGTGKTTYAKKLVREKSETAEVPDDICYVYNFSNSEKPCALSLPAGQGVNLQKDMNKLIEELKTEIPQVFTGEEYKKEKNQIMNEYRQESNQIMEEFEKDVKEQGFTLQNMGNNLVPVPLNDNGEPIEQNEFQQLDEEKRSNLREKSQQLQDEMEQVMRKINNLKSEAKKELKNKEKKIALSVIQPIIATLKGEYEDYPQVINYLKEVQKDITNNLNQFKNKQKDDTSTAISLTQVEEDDESFFTRYKVNLLVDNSDLEGAPVVYESNPTYYNLFGKIEGKSQLGTITTDFTMIKEGAIHEANGGYLIVKAKDVLTNALAWKTMKRILLNQKIVVENIGEQYRSVPITTLKPEAIPVNIKIIMIGNPLIYQLLYNYDEEFKKLFKVKAAFDVKMERNEENIKKFASFISSVSDREDLRHFTAEAVSKIIEYSSRLASDRRKLSTQFNEILELLFEANVWADENNDEYIDSNDIIKAIEEKEYRYNLLEEKIQEMINRGHILVDVKGKEVGQINGLSVYQTGQYSFGRPTRITARTFLGQEGVVNIEREVDMSGKIHNKGVMILSGFLGGKYAQEQPLSLSASLTFEQNYGGIDGDSASCAELIGLLSAISGLPIKQDLAITGSMNQKGIVQPIGGVNEKIEGFYKVCKLKGLTGNQGVVIPKQNEDNLMLKPEIIEAVNNDKFNIYSVKEIDEAIEIMMETEAEEVHEQVKKELKQLADKVTEFVSKSDK